ncbi:MAG: hypothetical protein NZ959_11355, partial [Armatimonadetes bacterium]|nr:hypothetical protein [Armatimonadota bacterium]MDW8122914.1 DUF6569 family protein [Armatimonadota bacterium]
MKQTLLKDLRLEEPQGAEDGFRLFPVVTAKANGRGYITFEEAMENGLVTVPETGSVPELTVTVKGEEPVLVPEGTLLIGGLQNRTVNITLLLEPGKTHPISVSCVERGRWHPREHRPIRPDLDFEPGPAVIPYVVRAAKVRSLSSRYARTGRMTADQSLTWERASRLLSEAEVDSPTEDTASIFINREAHLSKIEKSVHLIPNQVGVVCSIGSRIVGLEVFDHPLTWQVLWKKIVRGYAVEALVSWRSRVVKGVVSKQQAEDYLEKTDLCLATAQRRKPPVGLGEHLLMAPEHGPVSGFALAYNERLVHLVAFPTV